MKLHRITLSISLAVSLAGCASAGSLQVLEAVGPGPLHSVSQQPEGYLVVYSATDPYFDQGIFYEPHSSYTLHSEDGNLLKRVQNASDYIDQTPTRLRLPVGTYHVHALARRHGTVVVPVVIEHGRTTYVHLDREPKQPALKSASNQQVRLPNRKIVGWKANTAEVTTNP